MKVLFLELDTQSEWAVASIGPAFIASFLRRAGHQVEMLRVAVEASEDEAVESVRAVAPGLLALSMTSRQWLRGRSLVAAVRQDLDIPVLAGGLHPTFSPEEVLTAPGFDFVCLGEGEEATLDLVHSLQEPASGLIDIDNIWVRGGPRPSLRPPLNLEDVPFLARDLLDEPNGVVHISTQRGCPYPCTYCAARNFDQLYQEAATDADSPRAQRSRIYGRRRSQENVLAELAELEAASQLSYVIFLDDTFTIRRRWVESFCRLYGERFGTPFSLHARVETVDQKLLEQLASAGCRHITYGVESGSEQIRREVMKRPITDRRIREVFEWTKAAGIMVTANYMLGVPGETRADLQKTRDFAEELDAFDFGFFVFYPYPGTQLFDHCRREGFLPDNYLELPASHRRSILELPGLTKEDVAEAYESFLALREQVYLRRYSGPESGKQSVVDLLRRSALNG